MTNKTTAKRINHRKMLNDICNLVETNFCFEMDCRNLPNTKPFTQEEAKEMNRIIGRVYLIAHGIHCVCGNRYRV